MRNPARGDVWLVWLYAAAAVALGAWLAPWLYNAGMALAEVSSRKTTNEALQGLAGVCQTADFPRFYAAGLLLAGALLFFPWLEWLHLRHGAAAAVAGQPLRAHPQTLWHAGAGFLLAAGLLLVLELAVAPAGWSLPRHWDGGVAALALKAMAGAVVLEAFFRGLTLGVFLRAMRPAAALGMSALFFALVMSAMPLPGENVADPEAAGTGFEMLRLAAWRFADWRSICGHFAPLLALGGVLAYARWRTAALWLPIGLHAGWWFARTLPRHLPGGASPVLSGSLLQQAVLPLAVLLVAGVLTHRLTATPHPDAPPADT